MPDAKKLLTILVVTLTLCPGLAQARALSRSSSQVSVPDGSGGTYIAWADNRDGDGDIYLLRVTAAGAVATGWPAQGLAVCDAPGDQSEPVLRPDGVNGVLVYWLDFRGSWSKPDGYAQRVNSAGVPQWPANGVKVVSSALASEVAVAPDGTGGLLVAWSAMGAGDLDIFATRFTGAGALASGWSASGVLVCGLAEAQTSPAVTDDGAGGAIVEWVDERAGSGQSHAYAQRLNSSGVEQWLADGKLIDGSSLGVSGPAICADGSGGMFSLWAEPTAGGTVYAQHTNSAGTPQWMTGGINAGGTSSISGIAVVLDGQGGVNAAWNESSTGSEILRAQRLDPDGAALWGASGVVVASSATASAQLGDVVADGTGAAYVMWQDGRNGTDDPDIFAQRISDLGSPVWTANGMAVCSAGGEQSGPVGALDGSGGLVVVWLDYRASDTGIFAQHYTSAGAPQLAVDGTGVYQDPGVQSGTAVLQTDAGGAFVFWNEKRGGQYDLMARRFNADGSPAGPSVAICAAAGHQSLDAVIDDGAGGAIVSWTDRRSGGPDIYAQRIDASGAPQWTANGVAVCTASGTQQSSRMVTDGAGGAILAWQDGRAAGNPDVYAQRVSSAGAPQWTANGIAVCADAGYQQGAVIASDGAGGAIIAWSDYRDFLAPAVYAQRVNGSGMAQWTANGASIAAYTLLPRVSEAASGTANDAIVLVSLPNVDLATGTVNTILYAQRVSSTGAAQWGATGTKVCDVSSACSHERMVGDGAGGAFVAWSDGRSGVYDIFAQRLSSAGAAQWTANGLAVCNAAGWQYLEGLTRGASNDPYLTWEDQRSGQADVYAHHLDSSGAAQWAANGVAVCTAAGGQYYASLAPWKAASPCRIFTAWTDDRAGTARYAYVQRLDCAGAAQWTADGLTSTQLSLVSASADERSVRVSWYAPVELSATVERSDADRDWTPVGRVVSDGAGRIAFEDRDVAAGGRYGYRLAFTDAGALVTAGEVWVEVPAGLALALEGLRPNPAPGGLVVSFTLASRDPARLELVDVAGRRVLARDLGGLGPGRHTLRLDVAPPSSGVYFLRLTQAGRSVTARAAVTR